MSFSELELPGVFNIVVSGGIPDLEGQLLTDDSRRVTILPPGDIDESQKWEISIGKDKGLIIRNTSDFGPLPYLSYVGAPDPKQGSPIVMSSEPTEWQGVDSNLRPVRSDLGIAVAPPAIFPPILILSADHQLQWRLVLVSRGVEREVQE